MKKMMVLLFIFGIALTTQAQLGLKFNYGILDAPAWKFIIQQDLESLESTQKVYLDAYGMSVDYAFSLKNMNIKLLPEASFIQFHHNYSLNRFQPGHGFKTYMAGFSLMSHLYFLDLKGDALLPAAAKKGSFLKKNLFLRPSFGFKNYVATYFPPPSQSADFIVLTSWNSVWTFETGIGLGLDLGLSDFLTISPIVEIKYANPDKDWTTASDSLFIGNPRIVLSSPSTSLPANINLHTITTLFGIRMEVLFN